METIPQIVRDRLTAATSIGHHPEADVITAFAERTLPDRERADVLAHLASCADCREILALALPASEEVQTVIVPVRRGFFTWPQLRWGFAAAGVVIVSLGVLQYQRHLQPRTMARSEPVAKYAQTPPSSAAPGTKLAEKEEKSSASLDAMSADKANHQQTSGYLVAPEKTQQPSVPEAGGAAAGLTHRQLPHGPRMPTQWQQQNAKPLPPVPPAVNIPKQQSELAAGRVPSAPESLQVESAAAAPVTMEAQNKVSDRNDRDEEGRNQSQTSQSQPEFDYSSGIGKAKEPVKVEAANAEAQAETGANMQELPRATGSSDSYTRALQLTASAPAPLPRWSISPEGRLQRSFDQGRTWQIVDVNASLLFPAGLKKAQAAPVARSKVSKDDKTALNPAGTPIVFRAVSAIGMEVWAGGANGALYHSADAGAHWAQVVPSSEGLTPTGDIVRLEFSDSQHGTITTSTGEVWTTNDNGQTWRKQ